MRLLPLVVVTGCAMDFGVTGNYPDPEPIVPDRIDLDADGYTAEQGDCDDLDDRVGPGYADRFHEACDGLDNDCDSEIDDGQCETLATFTQHLQVDVLLVVDTSIGMVDPGYLDLAAEGARGMINHLRGVGLDTQIGVVIADAENPEASGRLVQLDQVPGRRWISGTEMMSDAQASRWLWFAVGDHEPQVSVPACRQVVDQALFDLSDDVNNGFFRTSANLAVVFVTAQEDHSSPTSGDLLSELRTAKLGTDGDVTVYAITQIDDTNCEGLKVPAAQSVLELVSQTEGMFESICRDDYNGFLSAVAQDIATKALGSTFHLAVPAQLGSVSVSVTEPGTESSYSWVGFGLIDAWTLVFTERPPAGSLIEVSYLEDWSK